jgi:predicted patatin/cPLA2 family phospholipase
MYRRELRPAIVDYNPQDHTLENFLLDGSVRGNPIIDRLQGRAAGKLTGKTTLIIGPGGMAGVFGTGVGQGLDESGMSPWVDLPIGISAGTPVTVFWLSGQSEQATSIFCDDLTQKGRFIRPSRELLRGNNVMDIDYMGDVLENALLLPEDRLRNSGLRVGVTDANTGRGQWLDMQGDIPVVPAMKASSAVPIAYTRPVTLELAGSNQDFYDGYIGNGIGDAVDLAKEEGATDFIVVLNRPLEDIARAAEGVALKEKVAFRIKRNAFTPEFRTAALTRPRHAQRLLQLAEEFPGISLGIFAPHFTNVKRDCQDRGLLVDAAIEGRQQVLAAFPPVVQ